MFSQLFHYIFFDTIALSYPPRVRDRVTVKLSAVFFHDESSITIGGVRKCNSAYFSSFLLILVCKSVIIVDWWEKKEEEVYSKLFISIVGM